MKTYVIDRSKSSKPLELSIHNQYTGDLEPLLSIGDEVSPDDDNDCIYITEVLVKEYTIERLPIEFTRSQWAAIKTQIGVNDNVAKNLIERRESNTVKLSRIISLNRTENPLVQKLKDEFYPLTPGDPIHDMIEVAIAFWDYHLDKSLENAKKLHRILLKQSINQDAEYDIVMEFDPYNHRLRDNERFSHIFKGSNSYMEWFLDISELGERYSEIPDEYKKELEVLETIEELKAEIMANEI